MSHVPFGGPPPELLKNNHVQARGTRPTTPRPYPPTKTPSQMQKSSRERIPPMKVTPKNNYKPPVKQLSRPKKSRRTDPQKSAKLHDFLLGFFIGLAIFGVAAIFLCNALIALFM